MHLNLRIGTRDSRLALWQSHHVGRALRLRGHAYELIEIKSEGDLDLSRSLADLGTELAGRGVFTKSLDDALLDKRIDLAVHSCKDIPTSLPAGLAIAAVLEREDPRDVLVVRNGLDFLNDPDYPAIIATGSVRRRAQWLHRYPKHQLVDLRGNVTTRLQKLYDGNWDAAVFAAAGLKRLELNADIATYLDWMRPAPAQGAIAIVTREDDTALRDILMSLHHSPTARAIEAERQMLAVLEGGCSAPIGALARLEGDQLVMDGTLVGTDGRERLDVTVSGPVEQARVLGQQAAEKLLARGGAALLPIRPARS